MALSQNLMKVLDRKERVRKWILEPLVGRGSPPRSWSEEAWFADALQLLGDYPEPILEAAALKVRAEHERATWPLVSQFKRACEDLLADGPAPISNANLETSRRTDKAWGYVGRRLWAGPLEQQLGLRRFKERGAGDIDKWLFAEACMQLRAGAEEIHISEAQVEAYITEREAYCLEHYGRVEDYPDPISTTSILGETARDIVDRLRPAHVDPAVIERAKPGSVPGSLWRAEEPAGEELEP